MPKGVRTDPAVKAEFKRRVTAGKTVMTAAAELGIPLGTAYKWRRIDGKASGGNRHRKTDPAIKAEFFRRTAEGESTTDVCRSLGLPMRTGYNWHYFARVQQRADGQGQNGQRQARSPAPAAQPTCSDRLTAGELEQVRVFLAERRQRPSSKPDRSGKTTQVRIDVGLLERLRQKAKDQNLPMSECVNEAVEQWL